MTDYLLKEYVEIHKFCYQCGKEKIIKASIRQNSKKTLIDLMRSVFLCKNCGGETFLPNIETAIAYIELREKQKNKNEL